MSWRIVVISQHAKLDLKLGSMVVRGENTTKINLSEISTLIIENTAVSLTAALLCELVKQKIKVIFCDEQRNPLSELLPYYGSHDTSAKIRTQVWWDDDTKNNVWTEIVRNKITQQLGLLVRLEKNEQGLLSQYIAKLKYNDSTNREGHAAKVYFKSLFGNSFTRSEQNPINASLNYGYNILLSAINREIVSNGYITQLGIHHNNIFNAFNLGSDLMEPFRPCIDEVVYKMAPTKFDKDEKYSIINVLNHRIIIDGQNHYVNNGLKIYCKSVFDALNAKDIGLIRFYKHEL